MLNAPIHHLGYSVMDIRAAAKTWNTLGVGPFFLIENVAFDELRCPESKCVFDHSAAFAYVGDVGLELQQMHHVEPPELADALGLGQPDHLNHIAYAFDDPGPVGEWLKTLGHPEIVYTRSGPVEDRMHRVEALGHLIELHLVSHGFTAFWAAVKEAGATWDGLEPMRSAEQLLATLV